MKPLLLLTVAAFSATVCPARSASEPVPLDQVFIPYSGYDENDPVDAAVVGELPNPCYSVERPKVHRAATDVFRISLTARKRTSGACESGSSEDDPTPFQAVAKLGTLARGSYRIEFEKDDGTTGSRSFEVAEAPSEPDGEYAVVDGISMENYFLPGEKVEATLHLRLTSSCQLLDEPRIGVQQDVVVVLPIVSRNAGSHCARQSRDVQKRLDLSDLAPGQYSLFVRSRDGQAVYQPFEILHKWGT